MRRCLMPCIIEINLYFARQGTPEMGDLEYRRRLRCPGVTERLLRPLLPVGGLAMTGAGGHGPSSGSLQVSYPLSPEAESELEAAAAFYESQPLRAE